MYERAGRDSELSCGGEVCENFSSTWNVDEQKQLS